MTKGLDRRRIQSLRVTAWYALLLVMSVTVRAYSGTMLTIEPLPIEKALRKIDIPVYLDRPRLSADGTHVVYTTLSSPEAMSLTRRSPGTRGDRMPDGMILDFAGARLWVTDVKSAKALEINPGVWSNWYGAFSPQGTFLAFLSNRGGRPQLWIANLKTGSVRLLSEATVFVKQGNSLDKPVWSLDGRSIYALTMHTPKKGDPETPDDRQPTVKVHASGDEVAAISIQAVKVDTDTTRTILSAIERIDVESGKRVEIVTGSAIGKPYAYELSPSQKWLAFLTANSDRDAECELFLGPVNGPFRSLGMLRKVNEGGELYKTVFSWAPNDDSLYFVQNGGLWVVNTSDNPGLVPKAVAQEFIAGRLSAIPGAPERLTVPKFSADGRFLVVRLPESNLDEYVNEKLEFIVASLDGSNAKHITVSGKLSFSEMVTSDGKSLWQSGQNSFLFSGRDFSSATQSVIKVDTKTGRATTLFKEPANLTFISSVQPGTIIVRYTDLRTPPDLYEFDTTLVKRRRLTEINSELTGLESIDSFLFKTAVPSYDGKIRSVTTAALLPKGAKLRERRPAIVVIYAIMSYNRNEFGGGRMPGGELAQFWTSRGYVVLLADIRPLTPRASSGANIVREIRDMLIPQVYRAAELGLIDLHRVVLAGASFGGYAAVAVLTETSLFRAAVAYCPVALDMFSTPWIEWPQFAARIGTGAHPWNSFKQYLTNSPFHQSDKIRTPLLIIHGTSDSDNIPAEGSIRMFRGLEQLGATAQLALYEGEGHDISRWSMSNAVDSTRRTFEFVSRYAPVDSAAK